MCIGWGPGKRDENGYEQAHFPPDNFKTVLCEGGGGVGGGTGDNLHWLK